MAGRYTRTDPSQTIGIRAADRAGRGFGQTYNAAAAQRGAAERQTERLGVQKEIADEDRASREKMNAERLRSLIGGGGRLGQEARKMQQLQQAASEAAQEEMRVLDKANPFERTVARIPYAAPVIGNLSEFLGNVTGGFIGDSDINDLRSAEERRLQAQTHIQTGAGQNIQEGQAKARAFNPSLLSDAETSKRRIRQGLSAVGAEIPQQAARTVDDRGNISQADQQALQWAQQNPNDPRASKIMQRLRGR